MKRRDFIQALFGGLAALLGIALAHSAPAPQPRKRLLLQVPLLVGFQFHEGEQLWPRLRERQGLKLIREPDNRHDPRAVRVEWRGHRLGYLPRVENSAVSQLLDRGERVEGRIVALREEPNPWRRVELTVSWVEGKKDV